VLVIGYECALKCERMKKHKKKNAKTKKHYGLKCHYRYDVKKQKENISENLTRITHTIGEQAPNSSCR
jgi:hypothetical protein